jgi:hypothetical protein
VFVFITNNATTLNKTFFIVICFTPLCPAQRL